MTNNLIIVPELSKAITTALKECKNPYAQTYLQAIPLAIEEGIQMGMGAESGLKTQLLYCLSNMAHWRGETAKECKSVIKKYANGSDKLFVTIPENMHNN